MGARPGSGRRVFQVSPVGCTINSFVVVRVDISLWIHKIATFGGRSAIQGIWHDCGRLFSEVESKSKWIASKLHVLNVRIIRR